MLKPICASETPQPRVVGGLSPPPRGSKIASKPNKTLPQYKTKKVLWHVVILLAFYFSRIGSE